MRAQYIEIPHMRRDIQYDDTYGDSCLNLARAFSWLAYAFRLAFGRSLWMRASN